MNPCGESFADARASAELWHHFLLTGTRLTPDRPAVVELAGKGGQEILTYAQLARRVDDYAGALGEMGLAIGDRVVVDSDTSGCAIAMLLACASLGLTFIPVSPETPTQRVLSVMDAAEPVLYLQAAGAARGEIPRPVGAASFGTAGVQTARRPARRPGHRREIVATDPAYIVFTSGSTGRPKGVVMSHRAILAFYRGMLRHDIVTADDRVATTSPLQFDFSLLDIGLALGSGAAVVPVPRALLRWPRRFAGFLRDTAATQVDGVPSIWRPVLRHEPELLADLHEVRGILYSGEPFPLHELRQLQAALPKARIVNCFGSTESVACSFTDVPSPIPDELEQLSIGQVHPGAELLLIGDDGQPIDEPGTVGELYLRSPALFTGYWNDPDATGRALVPDPLDPRSGQRLFRSGDLGCRGQRGELFYRGRADSLVKIRGNRVELGEIERRLLDFPGIAGAAAVVLRRADRDPALAGFVVAGADAAADAEAGGPAVIESEVIAFCAEALPRYMVPDELHVLDELPANANGKVDRIALAAAHSA
jgi:amino acid adenylation domain-containing protein